MSTHIKSAAAERGARVASRVFTVPPGKPFLDCLAQAILSGAIAPGISRNDPLALADITLLLPTLGIITFAAVFYFAQ